MVDGDAASERKKDLWTWFIVVLCAGVVLGALYRSGDLGGQSAVKPAAPATRPTDPPSRARRDPPPDPPAVVLSMDPSVTGEGSTMDASAPIAAATPPSPIKLRREKAVECGVSMLSPTKFQHKLEGGTAQPTVDSYTAQATWGAVVVACIRISPTPPRAELVAAAERVLQFVRDTSGWKVLRERTVRVGQQTAVETDMTTTSGPISFSRARVFLAGDVIHVHILTSQYAPTAVPKLDGLLDSAQLNKKAVRGAPRPVDPAWAAAGWSSSPGWNPSTILPSVNTGGDVHVRAHTRRDGTRVRAHTRSRPKK